jgi:hypothetical protein
MLWGADVIYRYPDLEAILDTGQFIRRYAPLVETLADVPVHWPRTDEFSVPPPLAETLRRMLHPNPKERWSAQQIITSLSTMDLAARGIPRLSLKGQSQIEL